ncbi:MAG: trigger factor, partial [Clostridia bacterium]
EIMEKESDIQPIDNPSVAMDKFDEKQIVMTIQIPVLPEFEVGAYKGLTFKKAKNEVSEEHIQEHINRDLMRGSKLVDSDKPVANDDIVTLNFEGFVDGKAFDGGKAENYQLKIGSHTFIDNFEDQLVGLNKGDKKDVIVTFPAEYHEKSLAGKEATFKIEIINIRTRVMPKFDEEFVKNTSEFDTIEAYKENIKSIIIKEQEGKIERDLENDIVDKIVESTELEIPAELVEREQDRMTNGLRNQLAQQGLRLEDYLAYIGKSMDDYKAEQRGYAEKNVKTRFVLERIVTAENITVTNEEFDAKIAEIAKMQGLSVEETKKQMGEHNMSHLLNNLLMDKLFAFLKDSNTITE